MKTTFKINFINDELVKVTEVSETVHTVKMESLPSNHKINNDLLLKRTHDKAIGSFLVSCGYGHIKTKGGHWHFADLREGKIIDSFVSCPLRDRQAILQAIIPEDKWGPWVVNCEIIEEY